MTRRTHESADDESTGLLHDRVHRELAATRAARSRRVYSVGDTTTTGRRVIEVRRSQTSPARGGGPVPSRSWAVYYLLACPDHGERWTSRPEYLCRACARGTQPAAVQRETWSIVEHDGAALVYSCVACG